MCIAHKRSLLTYNNYLYCINILFILIKSNNCDVYVYQRSTTNSVNSWFWNFVHKGTKNVHLEINFLIVHYKDGLTQEFGPVNGNLIFFVCIRLPFITWNKIGIIIEYHFKVLDLSKLPKCVNVFLMC